MDIQVIVSRWNTVSCQVCTNEFCCVLALTGMHAQYHIELYQEIHIQCFMGEFRGKHKYHLVDWLTISKPYDLGGWNIRNLDWFSLALHTKSLWLVLN